QPHQQVICGDTRIVDQDGGSTILSGDAAQQLADQGRLSYVERHTQTGETRFSQLLVNGVGTRIAGGSTYYGSPLGGQRMGDGLTDATAGTGDQCNLSFKTHIQIPQANWASAAARPAALSRL